MSGLASGVHEGAYRLQYVKPAGAAHIMRVVVGAAGWCSV